MLSQSILTLPIMEYCKNEIPALWQTHTYKRAYSIFLLNQKKQHPLSKEEKNNQKPMGHICSPEKNFQPVNTSTQSYEYTISWLKEKIFSPSYTIENWMTLICKNENFLHHKDASCQVWLKLTWSFWRRSF